MTNNNDRLNDLQEGLGEFGEVTGKKRDRLEEFEPQFEQADVDPFELFMLEDRHQNITDAVYNQWINAFDQWRNFMRAQGRHPACPSRIHVSKFVEHQTETRGNTEGDVKGKLFRVNAAYEWMQNDPQIPTPADYNPFKKWLKKDALDNGVGQQNYPRLTIDDLREKLEEITNIRERAITVAQLKLGCRSTELANINLREIDIQHRELREHYSDMGSHPEIEPYDNAVYIPSDRAGNKREVDTILPLDEETRQHIVDWLLIRPDNGKEAVFFSAKGKRLNRTDIGHFWKQYWWPEYKYDDDDDEDHDSITPHWSRHFFTTWWAHQAMPRVQRKYLRGDRTDEYNRQRSAMDDYTHNHFEDIEDVYRENIFQLRLSQV